MRVECAVICESASVRDGLLNVLDGGVTNLEVPDLPANLPLTFALRVVLEPRETRPEHLLRLDLHTQHDEPLAGLTVRFLIEGPRTDAEGGGLVAGVSLDPFRIEHAGQYLIRATLDDHVIHTYPLRVDRATTRIS